MRTEEVVSVTSTSVGEGWWMGRTSDGREGILPEAYVERIEAQQEVGFKRSSIVTGGWGDDWDSEEEHKYEDPRDLVGPDSVYSVPASVPASSSAPTLSTVETSSSKPTIPRPRPPLPTSESGYNFSLGKFTSVFGKSNQVGEYLSGLTESTATLAKEAVLVNDRNKVSQAEDREQT